VTRLIGRRSALALAGGVLVLAAAGCSTAGSATPAQGGAGGSGNEVRLVTTEWKFEPGTLQVPLGKPVSLVLDNKGALEHDIMAPALNLHVYAAAKKTGSSMVTFDKPGSYDFECSIPGHKEAGMKGKIVIQ
jgi:cytochrome c oxidase subunit 2